MKARRRFPLLAKMFVWLVLHLLLLAVAFVIFLKWQLGLGLDSLLSGSAGERMRTFGDAVRDEIRLIPPSEWDDAIRPLAEDKRVTARIFDPSRQLEQTSNIPANVIDRIKWAIRPPLGPAGSRRPIQRMPGHDTRRPPPGRGNDEEGRPPAGDGPPPRGDDFQDFPPNGKRVMGGENSLRKEPFSPASRPLFLIRGDGGDGYWAGVLLALPAHPSLPRRDPLLLIRSDRLDGQGMFFEFKPWLWGGLSVLAFSLAIWMPLIWRFTFYIRRLTAATDHIAAGDFKISLPAWGNDELGNLGTAIEGMAGRLDHLISGQKRFLGDAAHELCAPLARLRTGLGILEMKLGTHERTHLESIETDAQELALLVEEILAFSRAGNRQPKLEVIHLETLLQEIVAREGSGLQMDFQVPSQLSVTADPALVGRACGNLLRNSRVHAGPHAHVSIAAKESGEFVEICVSDDGPGVSAEELTRLFEPFYRPDRSRSRDTGGSGLGLAIVRSAVELCGGEVSAHLPPSGGFAVTLRLRRAIPDARSIVDLS